MTTEAKLDSILDTPENDQVLMKSKKKQLSMAREKLIEVATVKMFTDLLKGSYNKKYAAQLKALSKDDPKPAHLTDAVLDMALPVPPDLGKGTSLQFLNNAFAKKKIHDRALYERALYKTCFLKKHAFIANYKRLTSLKKEKKETRDIIMNVSLVDH